MHQVVMVRAPVVGEPVVVLRLVEEALLSGDLH